MNPARAFGPALAATLYKADALGAWWSSSWIYVFGPVIGAFLLVFITQVILGRLLDFHLFATGLLLVLLVLAAPGGVLGLARSFSLRRRPRGAPAE